MHSSRGHEYLFKIYKFSKVQQNIDKLDFFLIYISFQKFNKILKSRHPIMHVKMNNSIKNYFKNLPANFQSMQSNLLQRWVALSFCITSNKKILPVREQTDTSAGKMKVMLHTEVRLVAYFAGELFSFFCYVNGIAYGIFWR